MPHGSSAESDESTDDVNPMLFLSGASVQFFSEEDEEEDEYDDFVYVDSVGLDEVDSALYQNPSRKLLENSEKMVMQGVSELLASKKN